MTGAIHRRDYFEYERRAASEVFPIFLPSVGQRFRRVADLGCGFGGCLKYLVDEGVAEFGVGVDHDREMVRAGLERLGRSSKIEMICSDLLDYHPTAPFDLVLLRDVVEHTPNLSAVLKTVVEILVPNGWCFISFAPFHSPFGGHQHMLKGLAGKLPFIHFLPLPFLLRLSRVSAPSYKSDGELEKDLQNIFDARLSVFKFERHLRGLPLRVEKRNGYLVRPEYRVKYNLPAVPNVFLSIWRELTCTGVYYLLRRT
jgi:SAM-dependent methyltransferase